MWEVVSPSHDWNFLGFGGTKTRLWVHYKVKININSSSQYIGLQYNGWEGDHFCWHHGGGCGKGHPSPMVGTCSKCWYKTQLFCALKCWNSVSLPGKWIVWLKFKVIRETIKWYILGPQREGIDNLFEIRALNYFWGHLQMFYFSEIVPRNVHSCMRFKGSWRRVVAYDLVITLLDIMVWEGDTASQDKNFSEIWVLKLRI